MSEDIYDSLEFFGGYKEAKPWLKIIAKIEHYDAWVFGSMFLDAERCDFREGVVC
jgi:hypothetical protein